MREAPIADCALDTVWAIRKPAHAMSLLSRLLLSSAFMTACFWKITATIVATAVSPTSSQLSAQAHQEPALEPAHWPDQSLPSSAQMSATASPLEPELLCQQALHLLLLSCPAP